jgi:alpha-L-fucosidase
MAIARLFARLFLFCLIASSSWADGIGESPESRIETPKQAITAWQAMRFGLFIHWGVYSIPAGIWDGKQIEKLGEQIQRHADISMQDYENIARQFNPINFDADEVVRLAKEAGMRYIVLTAKHHDGFAMFESAHTDFDIVDFTPYKKDILKQLAEACRRHGLKLGIYYSTPDWHFNGPNPERNPHDGKISVFAPVSRANEDYQVAQLQELLSNYGDIAELFFDMGEPTAEQSKRFRHAVKRIQANTLINGRVMNDQGDFLTMPDNHVPDSPITELPWETPGTFYHTWGYKSWVKGAPLAEQIKTQVRKLSSITSMGGNFLLNIGPKSDGSIVEYERRVLQGIGDWLEDNREAIFGTGLNPFNRLEWGLASTGKQKLYLHIYQWPQDNKLVVPGFSNTVSKAYLLTAPGKQLAVSVEGEDKVINLKGVEQDPILSIVVVDYQGELSILPSRSKAAADGTVVIDGNSAAKHGKYGRESYRSMLKDFYRSWYVEVPEAGQYHAEMVYKMRYDQKRFVLSSDGGRVAFTLAGNGKCKEAASSLDGNEVAVVSKAIKGDYRIAELGAINFDSPGIQQIYLRQGNKFELMARSADFNRQDQKYRSMNIEIDHIRLTPVEAGR